MVAEGGWKRIEKSIILKTSILILNYQYIHPKLSSLLPTPACGYFGRQSHKFYDWMVMGYKDGYLMAIGKGWGVIIGGEVFEWEVGFDGFGCCELGILRALMGKSYFRENGPQSVRGYPKVLELMTDLWLNLKQQNTSFQVWFSHESKPLVLGQFSIQSVSSKALSLDSWYIN